MVTKAEKSLSIFMGPIYTRFLQKAASRCSRYSVPTQEHCHESSPSKLCYPSPTKLDYSFDLKRKPTSAQFKSSLFLSKILKYGCPTYDNIYQYSGHILAYSNYHQAPIWVCECLEKKKTSRIFTPREELIFKPDPTVPSIFSNSSLVSFPESPGYSRGHMAACANHNKNQRAMSDTMFTTNICLQNTALNTGLWNVLETHIRNCFTSNDQASTVHILTGPLWIPSEGIMRFARVGNISVPTHFFKAILTTDTSDRHSIKWYIMPNTPIGDPKLIQLFKESCRRPRKPQVKLSVGLRDELKRFQVSREIVEMNAGFAVFDQFN